MNEFIPNIVVCGDKNELTNDFNIEFNFIGELKIINRRMFFEGEEISREQLFKLSFDYILCSNYQIFFHNKNLFYFELQIPFGIVVTRNFFKFYVTNIGFAPFSNVQLLVENIQRIENQLGELHFILDADNFFARADVFDYPDHFTNFNRVHKRKLSIDVIAENIEPMFRNIYDHNFQSLNDVKLRHYNVAVFTAERSIDEWLEVLSLSVESSDYIFCFIHERSSAFDQLKNLSIDDAVIEFLPAVKGKWLLITVNRGEVCRDYIVAHKNYYVPNLPEGYIKIHAGKVNSTVDLGFIGDDTGDNISELNPLMNELTAFYWVWKNTKSDYVGFSHYRRFFKIDDHIMTMNEAKDFLKDSDIIVNRIIVFYGSITSGFDEFDSSHGVDLAHRIFIKHLSRTYPECVSLVEKSEASIGIYSNLMFVTRWNVFHSYCRWIFSFLLPAAEEFSQYKFDSQMESRAIAYIAERIFDVFVFHYNLRVKNLPIINGPNESTAENFSIDEFQPIFTII